MSIEIVGKVLTTTHVVQDGSQISLGFEDSEGRPSKITLPSRCVHQLLMTLPHLIALALRAQYRDDSLRLVFPLNEWRIETASGTDDVILSLRTEDGFEVAFAVAPQAINQMHACVQNSIAVPAHSPATVN